MTSLIDSKTFTNDHSFSGAKGLVMIGDKTIVYRRSADAPVAQNLLDLPGGGRNDDESPFETYAREVKEEFGLTIKPEDIVYSRRYQGQQNPSFFGYHIVAQLPASAAERIKFGNEGVSYELMTVSQYLARTDAWTDYQIRTRKYIDCINSIK
ncbi:NUDIX domain-containing protein [bacterium]|nr:MAG: NUDIX domain-containing protein [bacterium]